MRNWIKDIELDNLLNTFSNIKQAKKSSAKYIVFPYNYIPQKCINWTDSI